MHDERAAADARRLRFDQVQYQLHRDRRIGRAAAAIENLQSCFDRERMRSGHHVFPGVRELFRLIAAWLLRCGRFKLRVRATRKCRDEINCRAAKKMRNQNQATLMFKHSGKGT